MHAFRHVRGEGTRAAVPARSASLSMPDTLHVLLPLQVAAGCDGLALEPYMHNCLAPRLRMPARCLRSEAHPQERLPSRRQQRSSRIRKRMNSQMQSRRNVHTDAL